MASERAPSDIDAMRRHLEAALDATHEDERSYHLREALQLLEVRRRKASS